MSKDLRIVFLGTPDFAAASLRKLVENQVNVVAVITAPDKPQGRGKQAVTCNIRACADIYACYTEGNGKERAKSG